MPTNILLLTNRDSDNTGDQVIEACDIALIQTVMKNLNVSSSDYTITSRAASIISQKYLATRDPEILKKAEDKIKLADIVVFGGAPLFNYLYQTFYERTALTVELAQKNQKPVIFSAIGIERYDEKNKKCQRLKQALNLDCVKQITTRDGIEHLEKFRENPNIRIEKVSDPAVFASKVFENFKTKETEKTQAADMCQSLKGGYSLYRTKQITFQDGVRYLWKKVKKRLPKTAQKPAVPPKAAASETVQKEQKPKSRPANKKIGIFVLRANGFVDNKVKFNRNQAAALWLDIARDLKERGYKYEFITSGHFGDEAYMDWLIREHGVEESKCVFNVNDPETLTKKISSYDGIITCRLHPSIIAFSFKVPCVSLIWNSKVEGFYQSIGYEDRMIETDGISSELVIERLEKAMAEGVTHDTEYLMSVYRTLFDGLKGAMNLEDPGLTAYSYDELMENLVPYKGTTGAEKKEKLKRKFRRTYQKYNQVTAQLRK